MSVKVPFNGHEAMLDNGKEKDPKVLFTEWLSNKVPESRFPVLSFALDEIEAQAKTSKLINDSLYSDLNSDLVKAVRDDISRSRIFRFKHKHTMNEVMAALNYLLEYTKETEEGVAQNGDSSDIAVYINADAQIQPDLTEILDEDTSDISVSTVSDEVSAPNDFDDASDEEYKVDFSNLSKNTVTSTKPKRLVYFGDVYYVSNWTDVFIKACSLLYEDYPRVFRDCRTEYLNSYNRHGLLAITDEKNKNLFVKAVKIADDYYLNGNNRSSMNLMITLKKILDRCLVDYENVSIFYGTKNNQPAPTRLHRRQSPARGNLDFTDASVYINSESQIQSGQAEILDENISVSTVSDEVSAPNDFDDASDEEYKVDFSNLSKNTVTSTKPKRLVYFGDVYYVSNWTDVFIKACSLLYEDYPRIFQEYRTEYLYSSDRYALIGVADEKNMNELPKPVKIAEDYYLNGKKSSSDLMITLRKIMDRCLVDYENVSVFYVPRNRQSTGTGPHRRQSPARENLDFVDVAPILKKYYEYGFKYDSIREIMRFRNFADEMGITLPRDDETLKTLILSSGSVIDGYVYSKSDNLPQELLGIVDAIYNQGVNVIFYNCLYEIERAWMDKNVITSPEMLKKYLKQNITGWYFAKNFMTKGEKCSEKEAVVTEIKRIWGKNQTEKVDDLSNRLPYIPKYNIQSAIAGNSSFVSTINGEYLFTDRFNITEIEKRKILDYVDEEFQRQGFASLSNIPLYDIEYENYELTKSTVDRAIYKKFLSDKYGLHEGILTKFGYYTNTDQLLRNYVKNKDECTLEEIENKVIELTGKKTRRYAFRALYENMIRVDMNRFVADKYVDFQIDKTDEVLSGFFTDKFGAIRDVTTFVMFPYCGLSWNHYLLESFCYRYSKKYSFFVRHFNNKNAGIIVEKGLVQNYDELLSIVLAKSDIELTPKNCGQYLYDRGYTAKRKSSNLNEIAWRAENLRGGRL